jgi:hypothetical protein
MDAPSSNSSNKGMFMFGALARRGASVLLAAAVLGGGVALGAGTASAESLAGWDLEDLTAGSFVNDDEIHVGSFVIDTDPAELAAGSVVGVLAGVGSMDFDDVWASCSPPYCVTRVDQLNAWLRGEADPGSTAGPLSESSG